MAKITDESDVPGPLKRAVARLTEMREEYGQRIAAIDKDVRKGLSADSKEQVVELENADVLAALTNEAREELAKVDRALARVEQGEYGLCVDCGETIEPKRLEIYPATVRCVACRERFEESAKR